MVSHILAPYLLQVVFFSSLFSYGTSESSISIDDLPPLLDADDIEYFFSRDLNELHWALANVFRRSARNPDNEHIVFSQLPEQLVSRGGGNTYTSAYKMKHDLEQAQYLADKNINPGLFLEYVLPLYRMTAEKIPSLEDLEKTAGLYPFRPEDRGLLAFYNKALHLTNKDMLRGRDGNVISLLSPDLNIIEYENEWHQNGVVVIDNLLAPEALAQIRQIMLESTVWYQTKMPKRFGGYVGAYIDDGLHDKLLLQLAWELHEKMPFISGHALRYLWAYKYDADFTGINLHADEAAVNVNIWLTPDTANLDPETGGLVVYTAKPPDEWSFAEYNTDPQGVREKLLEPTHFSNVTIPYRQNRAVIFDSALFHQTDSFRFRRGYENRRINLTLLYGKMRTTSATEEL